MWMTSCTGNARGGFGDFEKVSELNSASEEESWLSLARRDGVGAQMEKPV